MRLLDSSLSFSFFARKPMPLPNSDTSREPLLDVNIYNSNIIVFGGHMSGKTTLLKTLLVRMHQNIENGDNEEIYIIDFIFGIDR